jgi:hypothetical protein
MLVLLLVAPALFLFGMPLVFLFMIDPEDLGANVELAASAMYSPESVALLAAETGIPVEALTAYLSAAMAYDDVDWPILAGVGRMECDHGRSQLPGCPRGTANFCGARGPMQFLGNTWRRGTDSVPSGECPGVGSFTADPTGPPIPSGQEGQGYATDGDGNGLANPWDWLDATHSAGRMLQRNGVKDNPRGALNAYNSSASYIDGVLGHAARYREVELDLLAAGRLSAGGIAGPCPVAAPLGGTEPITETRTTPATRAMANAVIGCFGRGSYTSCYDRRTQSDGREGPFEHPRGRACDFAIGDIGRMPTDDERPRGDAMAAWVQANAAEMNVLQIIWYKRIWHPRDGNIPWSQWDTYSGSGATGGHYDHVHVSVKLMPGDPAFARCVSGIPCTE